MSERFHNVLCDPSHVADQYRDATKLDARARLYRRYAEPGQASFARWVFDAVALPPAARVLEVGCGSGAFWFENLDRIRGDAQVTLSDSSAAMIEAARAKLEPVWPGASFQTLDVAEIPYGDASFDVLIANHMLYHVADRPRALREIRRVLRPGGAFFATTNAWTHLLELRDVCTRFCEYSSLLPACHLPGAFDVENAALELQALFAYVKVRSRFSALQVDDAQVLVDYVGSMMPSDRPLRAERLQAHLQWRIELEGSFRVTAASALLIAR